MLEQSIRPLYQRYCVDPLLARCPSAITSNHVTLLSGLFGVAFIPLVVFGWSFLAVVALLLSGYLDTFDGSLARYRQESSIWGSVFDIVMDRVVEFAVIFGLFLMAPQANALWVILMLGSTLICITSFLVVGVFIENQSSKGFHYSEGLMERAEAFIFFILMTLLPSMFFPYLAILYTVLVLWTAVIRLAQFYFWQKNA